jgi:hypothetical protein
VAGTPVIAIAKSFSVKGSPYNPPCPLLKKRGNYKKLQEKSPFEKGGFRQQCPVWFLQSLAKLRTLVKRPPTMYKFANPRLAEKITSPSPRPSPPSGERGKSVTDLTPYGY